MFIWARRARAAAGGARAAAAAGPAAGPAAGWTREAATGCPYEELSCRMCLSFLFEPVTLPCGHCFCKTCVERERKERSLVCKECRDVSRVAPVRSYRVNVVLSNLLAKWFPRLHRAGQLRREGNELYADKKTEAALDKYNQAILLGRTQAFRRGTAAVTQFPSLQCVLFWVFFV